MENLDSKYRVHIAELRQSYSTRYSRIFCITAFSLIYRMARMDENETMAEYAGTSGEILSVYYPEWEIPW